MGKEIKSFNVWLEIAILILTTVLITVSLSYLIDQNYQHTLSINGIYQRESLEQTAEWMQRTFSNAQQTLNGAAAHLAHMHSYLDNYTVHNDTYIQEIHQSTPFDYLAAVDADGEIHGALPLPADELTACLEAMEQSGDSVGAAFYQNSSYLSSLTPKLTGSQ